jgi:hypothetical protein
MKNFRIGDIVWVDVGTYKGFGRIGGVANTYSGKMFYISAGPDSARHVIAAREDQMQSSAPNSIRRYDEPEKAQKLFTYVKGGLA